MDHEHLSMLSGLENAAVVGDLPSPHLTDRNRDDADDQAMDKEA